jgi:hypothetical protein
MHFQYERLQTTPSLPHGVDIQCQYWIPRLVGHQATYPDATAACAHAMVTLCACMVIVDHLAGYGSAFVYIFYHTIGYSDHLSIHLIQQFIKQGLQAMFN